MKSKYEFNAEKAVTNIVNWIKDYFIKNGPSSYAIVGISGGKDSALVAKLCQMALGPDRVIGVLMPQGKQEDIKDAEEVAKWLGIKTVTINIEDTCNTLYKELNKNYILTPRVTTNTPARIRMTTLYAIAAIYGGRVANTCNASEDYVGYSTKFGDNAGDFAPIRNYYVRDIYEMCKYVGVPDIIIKKAPADGLSGLTDEMNLGFSYDILDSFLIDEIYPDYEILASIQAKHKANTHKVKEIPSCPSSYCNCWSF